MRFNLETILGKIEMSQELEMCFSLSSKEMDSTKYEQKEKRLETDYLKNSSGIVYFNTTMAFTRLIDCQ